MDIADLNTILHFAFATLLPAATSILLTLLGRTKQFADLGYWPKQVIYGLVFGAIAVYGTEAGIVTHDATMNVRDAAPLTAGLFFGGPAGIIAGVIGGVERWFAALWGAGMLSRVGCSVATILAGVFAALLCRFVFDGERPRWLISFALGVMVEASHMLLILLTNMNEARRAFFVVWACNVPMIVSSMQGPPRLVERAPAREIT